MTKVFMKTKVKKTIGVLTFIEYSYYLENKKIVRRVCCPIKGKARQELYEEEVFVPEIPYFLNKNKGGKNGLLL